jgi:hypothetical protein
VKDTTMLPRISGAKSDSLNYSFCHDKPKYLTQMHQFTRNAAHLALRSKSMELSIAGSTAD